VPRTSIFSGEYFAVDFRGMVRDDSEGLNVETQNPRRLKKHFRAMDFGRGISRDDFRASRETGMGRPGLSPMLPFWREKFSYLITDPTRFDPGTPMSFQFRCMALGRVTWIELNSPLLCKDYGALGNWSIQPQGFVGITISCC